MKAFLSILLLQTLCFSALATSPVLLETDPSTVNLKGAESVRVGLNFKPVDDNLYEARLVVS